jgi:hypothetical protein
MKKIIHARKVLKLEKLEKLRELEMSEKIVTKHKKPHKCAIYSRTSTLTMQNLWQPWL